MSHTEYNLVSKFIRQINTPSFIEHSNQEVIMCFIGLDKFINSSKVSNIFGNTVRKQLLKEILRRTQNVRKHSKIAKDFK